MSIKTNRHRGIYILPSLFTTMGLFAGFYSLIASVQGLYEVAAWSILAAAIFDMLDGRVARLLNAETDFGAEFDSLCDMLSFGIAPSVLIYLWALPSLGKAGWLAAFIIVAGSALRLARFNVEHDVQDHRYFHGLPTPATALLTATLVLFYESTQTQPTPWFWGAVAVALGYLMVSNVRFISGKDLDLQKRRPFIMVMIMVAIVSVFMLDPYRILFGIMMVYCTHGPLMSIWQSRKAKQLREARRLRRANKRKQPPSLDDDKKE